MVHKTTFKRASSALVQTSATVILVFKIIMTIPQKYIRECWGLPGDNYFLNYNCVSAIPSSFPFHCPHNAS